MSWYYYAKGAAPGKNKLSNALAATLASRQGWVVKGDGFGFWVCPVVGQHSYFIVEE